MTSARSSADQRDNRWAAPDAVVEQHAVITERLDALARAGPARGRAALGTEVDHDAVGPARR